MNKFKDMLENENDDIAIEYEGVDLIISPEFITLSRLLSPQDAHTVKFRIYDTAKSLNDLVDGHLYERNINSVDYSYDDRVTMRFSALPSQDYTGKSIIIMTNNNVKLLILNEIDTNTSWDLRNNILNIYFK